MKVDSNSCWNFNPKGDFYRTFENPDPTKKGFVLLIGDSFRSEIAKFFACSYRTTVVIKRSTDGQVYEQVLRKQGKPDLVIELFIQRYMDQAY